MIPTTEVYLAQVNWSDHETRQHLLGLAEEDRQQAARYRHPERLRSFVASRWLLRQALTGSEGRDANWRFGRQHNRLTLDPQQTSRHASLSHTPNWVACILSDSRHCGIDLEQRQPNPRLMAIAQRFFHPDEYQWLLATPDDQRLDLFLDLWTRKEACVKAWHCGLAHHLAAIRFNRAMLAPASCPDAYRMLPLTVQCWRTPTWQLCAAVNSTATTWRLHQLTL